MRKQRRTHLLKIGITSVALLVFLLSTDPNRLSVGFLFVPVALVFFVLYFATQLFIELSPFGLNFKKRRTFSLLCAAMPTLGLLLKSIDQLTVKDISLLLMLIIAGSFYLSVLRFERVPE